MADPPYLRPKLEECMKKVILAVIAASLCLTFNASTIFAAACDGVRVTQVGTSTASASNLIVELENISGATCFGDVANGGKRFFALTTTNTDQMYAGLLTALSLNSTLFANTSGAGTYLDVLIDITLKAN